MLEVCFLFCCKTIDSPLLIAFSWMQDHFWQPRMMERGRGALGFKADPCILPGWSTSQFKTVYQIIRRVHDHTGLIRFNDQHPSRWLLL